MLAPLGVQTTATPFLTGFSINRLNLGGALHRLHARF